MKQRTVHNIGHTSHRLNVGHVVITNATVRKNY